MLNHSTKENSFRLYTTWHRSTSANRSASSWPVAPCAAACVCKNAAAAARSLTEEMFSQHPDMCGLFISGGGITGALSALRDCAHRRDFVAVGYELFDLTRDGLVDGTLTLVISHPMETLARETISAMVKAKSSGTELGAPNVTIDFEIFTSENV